MNFQIQIEKFKIDYKSDLNIQGFIIEYKNTKYIITLHQNLPINNNILLNDINYNFNILINSGWSELLILEYPNDIENYRHTIYNKIQNKLPKKEDKLYLDYKNLNNYKLNINSIDFISINFIDTIIKLPFIIVSITNILESDLYKDTLIINELIGLPVLFNNNIIGIITRVINQNIFVLPIYIVIKNLIKQDNNNIYILNNIENIKKIGNNIINEDTTIYHTKLKYKIPLNTYFLLEGDINKEIKVKLKSNIYEIVKYEKYNLKLSNEINIINIKNIFKLTSRLMSLIRFLSIDKNTLITLVKYLENNDISIWIKLEIKKINDDIIINIKIK